MVTMNVSLPDELKAWVESQARGGRYASSSDVVRDLVRQAIEYEKAVASLNAAIDKGLASGIVKDYDPVARRKKLRAEFIARQSTSDV